MFEVAQKAAGAEGNNGSFKGPSIRVVSCSALKFTNQHNRQDITEQSDANVAAPLWAEHIANDQTEGT